MDEDRLSSEDIYDMLVHPVCALEEYINMANSSPIVDTIALALRHVLDAVEEDMYKEKNRNEKTV